MIAKTAGIPVNPLLQELNETYLRIHFEKEDAFWKDKMGLAARLPGDFETKEILLQGWISDPKYLPALRAELAKPGLGADDRIGLQGWLRFFEVHAIENPEAKALANRIVEMEGRLQEARGAMKLGYIDPATGDLIVFARDDDLILGILHSRLHEVWALSQGTQLETRPRYTPTSCFETFPFPKPTNLVFPRLRHRISWNSTSSTSTST